MNNVNSLKPRQLNAIKLLAMGTPAYQVAERLEVSTMTLYRWQRQPEFESRLNALAYSGLEEIAKQMNAASLTAVETLQQILCDMREPTTMRMKAALGVLNAMPAINSALEKGLHHKLADFDLQRRWDTNSVGFDGGECFVQGVQDIGG
jgi:transposase